MELLVKQPICIQTVQDTLTLLYGTDLVFRNGNLLDGRAENILHEYIGVDGKSIYILLSI